MLILTMAMNIHMSTRFLQLREKFPDQSILDLIILTTQKMFWPILYTVLTTIIAFLSLIFSDIKPIIDFGWMMTLGLMTSFLITFTLLPTLLSFAPVNNVNLEEINNYRITNLFSKISINNKNLVFLTTTSSLKFKKLDIVFNPEFLTERNAVNDYNNQNRIILGGPRPATTLIKNIFSI